MMMGLALRSVLSATMGTAPQCLMKLGWIVNVRVSVAMIQKLAITQGREVSMVSICDYESCLGCMEEGACNFNALSTTDDGSCFFVGDTCNDGNPSTANDVVEANCDCAGEPIEGF